MRRIWAGLLLVGITTGAAMADEAALGEFRRRHGAEWTLTSDADTARPRRLAGGSIKLVDEEAGGAEVLAAARAFLSAEAEALGIDVASLVPAERAVVDADGARVRIVRFDVAPGGIRVQGGSVVLALVRGRLVYAHLVGTAPPPRDATPRVSLDEARTSALDALGVAADAATDATLTWLRTSGDWRLAWRVVVITEQPPRRWAVEVDALTGDLSMTDETISSCDPLPPGGLLRRVTGGVHPRSARDAERVELLPGVDVGGVVAGDDGYFAPPGAPPYDAVLRGPLALVSCSGCAVPVRARAPSLPDGDVEFRVGGSDEIGNGTSTPAERTSYVGVGLGKRLGARWLDVPFLSQRLAVNVNVDDDCNAFWNGRSITFFRSSADCANTGEILDVIVHELGHGLDDNDGLRASSLSVDGATGEAAADIHAMLLSRDACIGESFFLDQRAWPSDACSGVRDLDERAPGGRATLTTASAISSCSAHPSYRGPLGREGHCEGEILGQAAWHLSQNLVTGVSYADGSPLPGGALGEDAGWEVLERLFFSSRPLLASYAPASLQSIGTSAFDAFLVVDDEGDGLANGTPHAAAILDAFAHHGLEEAGVSPPQSAPCVPPPDPVVTATTITDAASGRPAVRIDWTDTGAAAHEVVRSTDGRAYLPLVAPLGAGAGSVLDRGVLPGMRCSYRVIARSATGCRSSSATPVVGTATARLVIVQLRIDDAAGDGDGRLDRGETADVWVDIYNDGSAVLPQLALGLETDDARVVVVDPGPVDFGDVALFAHRSAPAPFRVSAQADAPRFVTLSVAGESAGACQRASWVLELDVPDLQLVARSETDLGGDADGIWEAGEGDDITFDLRNAGLGAATGVTGVLSFQGVPPAGVAIVTSTGAWDEVPSGEVRASRSPAFSLTANASVPPRTPVRLALDVMVAGLPHATHDITLVVGGFPPGTIRWSRPASGLSAAPIVLPLDDDDGDGRLTACDAADIVYARRGGGVVRTIEARSGVDGSLLWSSSDPTCLGQASHTYTLAGGDIDGDGWNEVLTVAPDAYVCAWRGDGTLAWRSPSPTNLALCCDGGTLHLADVDADGVPEAVAALTTLDGRDGSISWQQPAIDWSLDRVVVADLDVDDCMEVVALSESFHCDGSPAPARLGTQYFPDPPLVVNLDADPEGEIVFRHQAAGSHYLMAIDHDGSSSSPKWTSPALPIPFANAGAPCAGDVDGDGRAEIAVAAITELVLLDDDGSIAWTTPIDDPGGHAWCSMFDFDDDGGLEIALRDYHDLRILDGRSGDPAWSTPLDGLTTGLPVIADVTGDGRADIVATGTPPGGAEGINVYSNPRWARARAVWNQEAYSATNVGDAGGIPQHSFPSWLVGNDFRAQHEACGCDGPQLSIDAQVTCGTRTACFTAIVEGGVDPRISWDLDDGYLTEGLSVCHEFASSGPHWARARLVDEGDCALVSGRILTVPDPPVLAVMPTVGCAGEPTCFAATLIGGSPDTVVSWDFDDGSPVATGLAPCHVFAAGSYVVRVVPDDGSPCGDDAPPPVEIPILVTVPAGLREVSGPGAPPLLVRRAGASFEVSWEDAGFDVGVYAGDLSSLGSGYSHRATSACRARSGSAIVGLPGGSLYLLAAASACASPRLEGSFGSDSLGRPRPSTAALGQASCP